MIGYFDHCGFYSYEKYILDFAKWVLWMLYYDRNNLRERFNVVKSNDSNKYIVCHYLHFSHGFKFEKINL